MDAREELLGIAEIAVTLVGFSGLISAFRARTVHELEPRDLSALAMVLGSGGVALAFALLPLPFSHLGVDDDVLWRSGSAVFGLVLAAGAVVFRTVSRRLAAAGHPERTPRLNRTTLVSLVATAFALLASAAWPISRGPGVYLFGLVVCVLQCVVFVAFMLVVARRSEGT